MADDFDRFMGPPPRLPAALPAPASRPAEPEVEVINPNPTGTDLQSALGGLFDFSQLQQHELLGAALGAAIGGWIARKLYQAGQGLYF